MDTESADIKAIEGVVATVERTHRTMDADGFLALFHPDAVWTAAYGKVLIGIDEIAGFTVRQVYRSAEGGTEGAPSTY